MATILMRAWRCASLLVFLATLPAHADAGKELFEKQCSGCHTVGGGDKGGPDLKGVTARRSEEWLVRVITEPDRLTAEKDPVQLELVKKYGFEMPKLGIGREDALKIIAWLKGEAPGAAKSAAEERKVEVAPTPELVASGLALFTGERRFAKGGAPCAACHRLRYPGVSGGKLAADLSDLYEGMGEEGLRGVLGSLQFPVMKKAYAGRPLTDEEIAALIAFMKDATAHRKGGEAGAFPLAGAGVFALCLAAFALYKRRIG